MKKENSYYYKPNRFIEVLIEDGIMTGFCFFDEFAFHKKFGFFRVDRPTKKSKICKNQEQISNWPKP